jgi:predicted Rossmann fold flavoprotein
MTARDLILVAGGGAAGFFGAITAAESAASASIMILERGPEFLQKASISGGGRCNVTHACFDPDEFVKAYPRGSKELLGPLHRFQAKDTVAWFESRGVALKTEKDGRMFPVTDRSATVVDCLMTSAMNAGVELRKNCALKTLKRLENGFEAVLSNGGFLYPKRVLFTPGGIRSPALGGIPASLGHSIVAPVPSLFTFSVREPSIRALAGISTPLVEVSAHGIRQRGPILFTHAGLSGPSILRLSAWGARVFHSLNYQFTLKINWMPETPPEEIRKTFDLKRSREGTRSVQNSPLAPLSLRLWQALVFNAGIDANLRWAALSRTGIQALLKVLQATEVTVMGKSLNKEEFVTCGGVKLSEVNFKTMESRLCPGLYFAGEVLDLDGVTGGFNFQAAWTTGWVAGRSMAEAAD